MISVEAVEFLLFLDHIAQESSSGNIGSFEYGQFEGYEEAMKELCGVYIEKNIDVIDSIRLTDCAKSEIKKFKSREF